MLILTSNRPLRPWTSYVSRQRKYQPQRHYKPNFRNRLLALRPQHRLSLEISTKSPHSLNMDTRQLTSRAPPSYQQHVRSLPRHPQHVDRPQHLLRPPRHDRNLRTPASRPRFQSHRDAKHSRESEVNLGLREPVWMGFPDVGYECCEVGG